MACVLTAGQIYQPSSILTIPLLHPALNTVFFFFFSELTRVHPYIHPAGQPPLTFLTPRCASLQSEALQTEPAWGQVAGRTRLQSGLVDLCGSQFLLTFLSTFNSSVPSICPLSNSNPGSSASEISLHLSHHDPLTCSYTSEASVVCLDENLGKIRSSFPYLPTSTVILLPAMTSLTLVGISTYEVLDQSLSLTTFADCDHQRLWMCQ